MADRTPSRGPRTSRLSSKPYARPDSAANSRNGTPVRQNVGIARVVSLKPMSTSIKDTDPDASPVLQRGFLSSVADMLFSPFGGKSGAESSETNGHRNDQIGEDEVEDDFQMISPTKAEGSKAKFEKRLPTSEPEIEISSAPIQPIRDIIDSLAPIDPLQSIHLINDFNRAKHALRQPHTREEQRAIEELIRRADADSPTLGAGGSVDAKSPLRGAVSSANLRQSGRLGRAGDLREGGLSKSSSMNFTNSRQEEDKPSTPLKRAWKPDHSEAPSPPGRFPSPNVAVEGLPNKTYDSPSKPQTLNHSVSNTSLINRPIAGKRFAPIRASGLSKSQSMFSLPKQIAFPVEQEEKREKTAGEGGPRQRVNALVGPTKPVIPAMSNGQASTEQQKKPQVQKTAAARELEDMLKQVDDEEGKKTGPVEPVVNPYEHYRFNIGSTAQSSRRKSAGPGARRLGGLAERRAVLAAAEAKERERNKRKVMTDLDMINENLGDRDAKRRKMDSPEVQAEASKESSPEIQMISSPSPKKSKQPALPASTSAFAKPSSAFTFSAKPQDPPKQSAFGSSSQTDKPAFSFGTAAQASKDAFAALHPSVSSQPQITTVQAAKSAFEKRKNDAIDIVMSHAAASPTIPTKLTPTTLSASRLPITSSIPPIFGAVKPVEEKEQTSKAKSAREEVLAMQTAACPVFVYKSLANVPSLAVGISIVTQQKVKNMSESELPVFTFGSGTLGLEPFATSGFAGFGAISSSSTAPASSSSTGDAWICSLCSCKSKGSSTKCDVCEEPRPGSAVPKPATTGFTGWGASASKPSTSAEGEWTCSLCSCKSKASSQKCDVCEADRPKSVSATTAAPVTGFSGWGAGAMLPKAGSVGEWTCGMCGCKSKASSKDCEVCESPRS